ncbi:GDSL-type esterase/lipase family protein [Paenibacillus sp. S-38]|uniref:GDSL-type esterase/lipase family protein n=1 Tax=Paenibacillus sp. S-38 TaxID=3416710 RepID=UPI003CF25843
MRYHNVELHNVETVLPMEGGRVRLSRVPEPVRLALNPKARDESAYHTCGCEIRFVLRGDEARITLRQADRTAISRSGQTEVYFGPFQGVYPWAAVHVDGQRSEIVVRRPGHLEQLQTLARAGGMGFDPAVVRIILPSDGICELAGIEGDLLPPSSGQLPAQRLLCYGSSITHGGDAVRPAGTYAMRTASRLGMDLIHLGFAGSAHMDEAMALYIASRSDWHLAVAEMGIHGIGDWEEERFARQVHRFLVMLSIGLRNRRLICTDLLPCPEEGEASRLRSIVRSAAEALEHPGVLYVPGTGLLPDMSWLSADLVHPSAEGHEEIGARLSARLRQG